MSFDNTYVHNVLIGLDQLGAALLFSRNDLTISTMCDMVMKGDDAPLKLSGWQRAFLKWLGPVLNKIQTNHCAGARDGDRDRATSTLKAIGQNGGSVAP
jgi:hypothetical protein